MNLQKMAWRAVGWSFEWQTQGNEECGRFKDPISLKWHLQNLIQWLILPSQHSSSVGVATCTFHSPVFGHSYVYINTGRTVPIECRSHKINMPSLSGSLRQWPCSWSTADASAKAKLVLKELLWTNSLNTGDCQIPRQPGACFGRNGPNFIIQIMHFLCMYGV